MTECVVGVSPVIVTLVSVCLCEEKASIVAETHSVSVGSAVCLENATAAFPMDKKVRVSSTIQLIVYNHDIVLL